MKTTNIVLLTVVLALSFLTGTAFAQNGQVAIPLSNPNQSGQLTLSMISGSLSVSGYDGKEVVIRYSGTEGPGGRNREETRNGLRRISGSSPGFEVVEANNHVKVSGVSPASEVEFDIMVPYNFSLKLSVVRGRKLSVENVNGELEINNVNGNVNLINVGGSALISAVNGDISASFENVSADKPMSFNNVNGNIDITVPANARFSPKMKTDWGDMFTDFEIDFKSGGNVDINSGSDRYRVQVSNWIIGEVNGGGPEYHIRTLHGDIYMRKR